ncbi:MAG: glycosyltransferase family 4 protein [Candidatus Thermoplasmatota archaeon]|nr:glycosyltransferase family 4 protein [Candidatus Thermoplasmatota archaeon]
MKIVMVLGNDFLKPFVDNRVYKEAKALVENGNEVTVICWARTIDNVPLNNLPMTEKYENINIIRVFQNISPITSPFFIRLLQHIIAFKKISKIIKTIKPDVVHCHDFNTLLSIIFVKKKNTKIIYDSHEDYPSMISDVCSPLTVTFSGYLEKIMVKLFTYTVITVCPQIAEKFQGYNVKTSVIINCKNVSEYNIPDDEIHRTRLLLNAEDKTMFLYIGSLGKYRGLEDLINVFKEENCSNAFLVIGGNGVMKHEVMEKMRHMHNARFIGTVQADRVPLYTKSADVIVSLLDPSKESHRIALPNKLFEAMAAGKPVIASENTTTADIVSNEKCGVVVQYGDAKKLHEGIIYLTDKNVRKKLGDNSLKAAETKYNWVGQEKELLNIYKSIMR